MDFDDPHKELDWNLMDMLGGINPSLLNNPLAYPHEQLSVQDSVGTVATPNQAQNIELSSFDFPKETTSSSMGNLSQLLADDRSDQLPPLPQNSFGPLLDETQSGYYIPSMEGVIPGGGGSSSVQSQVEMTPMDYYDQFSLLLDNNAAIMNNMGQQHEHNSNNQMMMFNHNSNNQMMMSEYNSNNQTMMPKYNSNNQMMMSEYNLNNQMMMSAHNSNNQMMMSNNLANQNFNEMSNQGPSSYPCVVQQNPVMIGNMNTNGHLMTDQTAQFSALDNHAINPCNAWNSPGEKTQGNGYNPLSDLAGFQEQSSTSNDHATVNSGFASSSESNSTFLGLLGSGANEGSISQLLNMEAPQMETAFRPGSAPVVQPQQVPPLSSPVNTITPLVADNGLPISPSLRAQPSVPIQNMLNLNDISTVTSCGGPLATLLQNPSVTRLFGRREPVRRGRPRKQFEPGIVIPPLRRRKRDSSSFAKGKARETLASQANNDAPPPVRKVPAPLYDIAFQKAGLHREILLRLYVLEEAKALAEAKKSAELAATKAPSSA